MLLNKLKNTVSLILLTLFCNVFLFAQTNDYKEPIYTEFIKANYLLLGTCGDLRTGKKVANRDHRLLKIYIAPMLSKRGSFVIDPPSNFFIVSDTQDNLKIIRRLMKFYDTPDYANNDQEKCGEDLFYYENEESIETFHPGLTKEDVERERKNIQKYR